MAQMSPAPKIDTKDMNKIKCMLIFLQTNCMKNSYI